MKAVNWILVVSLVVLGAGMAVAADELTATAPTPGAPGVPSVPQPIVPDQVEAYYADRATFQTANPGLPLEDFESSIHAPGSGVLLGCPEPFSSAGSTDCYNAGDLLPGFSMTSPGAGTPGAELIILDGAAGFGTPAGIIAGSNTFLASTRIDFNPPVTALGFDVISLLAGNPVNITIYDAAGAPIGGQTGVPAGAAGAFWGVDSTTPIAAILIEDPSGADVELLDDMEFGDPIPVELQSINIE